MRSLAIEATGGDSNCFTIEVIVASLRLKILAVKFGKTSANVMEATLASPFPQYSE